VHKYVQAVMTRWASDPMTYGSYSSVAVGSAGPADYAAMARPVGDRLFFAGEATSTRCVTGGRGVEGGG
jgi:lysine-specific histone demethylase 1